MDGAGPIFAGINGPKPISPIRDLPIYPLPQRQAEWNVEHRGQPPQPPQAPRKMPNCCGTAMPAPALIDDVHVAHHHLVRQVGISAGDFRIVKR